MKIIYNSFIPFKGFVAMNICGILFVRNEHKDKLDNKTINHEEIHTAQYKELLYVGFFILYILMWVVNLFRYGFTHEAYRNIAFEKEAYSNQNDILYLITRKKFAWIRQ